MFVLGIFLAVVGVMGNIRLMGSGSKMMLMPFWDILMRQDSTGGIYFGKINGRSINNPKSIPKHKQKSPMHNPRQPIQFFLTSRNINSIKINKHSIDNVKLSNRALEVANEKIIQ